VAKSKEQGEGKHAQGSARVGGRNASTSESAVGRGGVFTSRHIMGGELHGAGQKSFGPHQKKTVGRDGPVPVKTWFPGRFKIFQLHGFLIKEVGMGKKGKGTQSTYLARYKAEPNSKKGRDGGIRKEAAKAARRETRPRLQERV